jgi:hypothetical protein
MAAFGVITEVTDPALRVLKETRDAAGSYNAFHSEQHTSATCKPAQIAGPPGTDCASMVDSSH